MDTKDKIWSLLPWAFRSVEGHGDVSERNGKVEMGIEEAGRRERM